MWKWLSWPILTKVSVRSQSGSWLWLRHPKAWLVLDGQLVNSLTWLAALSSSLAVDQRLWLLTSQALCRAPHNMAASFPQSESTKDIVCMCEKVAKIEGNSSISKYMKRHATIFVFLAAQAICDTKREGVNTAMCWSLEVILEAGYQNACIKYVH